MANQAKRWIISPLGPPDRAGVYCVMLCNYKTKDTQILYIGSSSNIKKRVMSTSHPYRQCMDEVQWPFMICLKFKECNNFKDLERKLIRRIRPLLNKQHSGIEYRAYKISLI